MEYEKIRQLIDDFGNSKLSKINLEFGDGTKINMEKECTETVNVVKNNVVTNEIAQNIVDENINEDAGKIIKSPMVGTFYIKPSPNAEPYVSVGKKVKKGDVVCIIEAMKLMNEIESEFDGEVIEILVKEGDIIEYGTPLLRLI